jgi:hypothetical protein
MSDGRVAGLRQCSGGGGDLEPERRIRGPMPCRKTVPGERPKNGRAGDWSHRWRHRWIRRRGSDGMARRRR